MKIQDINNQVKKNPLTYEESKEQFIRVTEQLNIKHSYNFDEAWEIGQEIRKRNSFREKVLQVEQHINDSGFGMTNEEIQLTNPLKHTFAGGCYIREVFNPAQELIVTKIHKKEHPFFLVKGEMSILTEDGVSFLKAPHHGITKPGTKRIIFAHTDCIFITVHSVNSTTVEDAEKEIIADDFNDTSVREEDMKLLTNKSIKQ